MARGDRPFLFCRYQITFDNEILEPDNQFTVLQELQGKRVPHGRIALETGIRNTLLMRPRLIEVEGYDVITWSAGFETKTTVTAKYDPNNDEIDLEAINFDSVRYADFVAVPILGVMAVDDRVNDINLGGRAAINRLKSIIRSEDGGELDVTLEASPAEVRKALESWQLTQFKFTIRPNNPRPVSRLGERLSEQMKEDGIGQLTATARPTDIKPMRMSDDGLIKAATDLIEAGYGQSAFSGITEEGLAAEIKKPRFHMDRERNERAQERPRELRVFVDATDMQEDEIMKTAAYSLIQFHRPAKQ